MSPKQRNLRRVAYHEAGHAVAASVLGVRFSRVTVSPDGYSDGAIEWEPIFHKKKTQRKKRLYARRLITFLWSAWFAERRFLGKDPEFGSENDERHAAEILSMFFLDHEATSVMQSCISDARSLVEKRWLSIESVAQALVIRKDLSSRELSRLLRVDETGHVR